MLIEIKKNIKGSILDVGGGGEGIIGRIYTDRVTAIDNRQEELDEVPDFCRKMLMDATNLLFEDRSFDNVTFFYSLMYMTSDVHKKAISEAARVLKKGGHIHIWDCDIYSAGTEPHIVNLDIVWDNNKVHTSYGIVKGEMQSFESVVGILKNNNILPEYHFRNDNHFFICGLKK